LNLSEIEIKLVHILHDYLQDAGIRILSETFRQHIRDLGGIESEIIVHFEHLGFIKLWSPPPPLKSSTANPLYEINGSVVEAVRHFEENDADEIEDEFKPSDGESQQFADSARRMQLVMVDESVGAELWKILGNDSLSSDEKMRQMCGLDPRFAGFKSPKWAEMLGVTANAIRQTETWKNLQRGMKEE